MMASKFFFRILKTEQKLKNERISFLVSILKPVIFKVLKVKRLQEVCLLWKNWRLVQGARVRQPALGAQRFGGESALGVRCMALGWSSLLRVLHSCALTLRMFFIPLGLNLLINYLNVVPSLFLKSKHIIFVWFSVFHVILSIRFTVYSLDNNLPARRICNIVCLRKIVRRFIGNSPRATGNINKISLGLRPREIFLIFPLP